MESAESPKSIRLKLLKIDTQEFKSLTTHPMARLEKPNYPERKINIEEKEGVSQQQWVLIAPYPQRRKRIAFACWSNERMITELAEEREIEENGRKRNQKCYYSITNIHRHKSSYCCFCFLLVLYVFNIFICI